jgi:beta propeller repeat protein
LEGGGHFFPTEEQAFDYCNIRVPNLVIVNIGFDPSILGPDEEMAIEVVVSNVGNFLAEGVEVVCTVDDSELDSKVIGLLESDGQEAVVTYIWRTTTVGEHSVFLHVDPENLIEESNELDNRKEAIVKVAPKPAITFPPQTPSIGHSKNKALYSKKEVFLISDENWRDVLQLVPLTIWSDVKTKTLIGNYPTLIYHREGNNVDADAIIRFLQQYNPTHLTIFGGTPQGLDDLLVAAAPTGAHMQVSQISKYSMQSYLSYWAAIDRVVISENDYDTGLMASVFASLLNAPLLFDGHFDVTLLNGVNCYTVGDISTTTKQEIQSRTAVKVDYTLEGLRQAYAKWADNNRVILVNPNDLTLGLTKTFRVEKYSCVNPLAICLTTPHISDLYTGHSLSAPFLAAAKYEVIISTTDNTYLGVDEFVEKKLESLKLSGPLTYITIIANPRAIPMARESRNTYPALWGNRVVFEEIDFSQIDAKPIGLSIVKYNSKGSTTVQRISDTSQGDLNPVIYKDLVVWQDYTNANWDIYMYDLSSNTKTQLTKNTNHQRNPAIYGDKIVWEDNRNTYKDGDGKTNHHWDIYMYDLSTNKEIRITTDTNDQLNPAVFADINYPDTIVWQDNRNTFIAADGKEHHQWDIYMYDISKKQETQVTADYYNQEKPAVYGSTIVWEDYGQGWYDANICYRSISPLTSIMSVTTDQNVQRSPSISGTKIVWEDNRNQNWDVYMYDLVQNQETRLTTGDNDQIRPIIQGYNVIWYSEGETGVASVLTNPSTQQRGGQWFTYLYDIYNSKAKIIHDNLLVHEYNRTFRQEVDGRYYGSSINYGEQDRAVGRIFGLTSSDVSAYIARVLFFDQINTQNRDALLIVREDHNAKKTVGCLQDVNPVIDPCSLADYAAGYWTPQVGIQFDLLDSATYYGTSGAGSVDDNVQTIRDLYDESYLILYADHGGWGGFDHVVTNKHLQENSVAMQPSTVLNLACATCTTLYGYTPEWHVVSWDPNSDRRLTFCIENIRRGAMVYMGAVDNSYWHRMFDDLLYDVFVDGQTIGEAYITARNEDYNDDVYNFCDDRKGDPFYALIGDPTFRPRWW